jgi:hypothetical protein
VEYRGDFDIMVGRELTIALSVNNEPLEDSFYSRFVECYDREAIHTTETTDFAFQPLSYSYRKALLQPSM